MSKKDDKTHLFDNPKTVKAVMYLFFAFCAVLAGVDFFVHRYTYHSWEEIPAFYAIFGFGAYVLIVITATILRKLVMRPEDFYESKEGGND